MPELPEVETVARQLARHLTGRTVKALEISDPKLRVFDPAELKGRKIIQVGRSGKEVLLSFSGERWLLIHLRMTGRLLWSGPGGALDSHQALSRKVPLNRKSKSCRARFELDRGYLDFDDVRRFGTFKMCRSIEEVSPPGADPVATDFTVGVLQSLLKRSSQPIKVWLLRQDRVTGIGNIYASEILYRSRIHPNRKSDSLSPPEVTLLHRSIVYVLNTAIKYAGTTFSDYRDASGEAGGFQNRLKVYDREGKACGRCKAAIRREVQAQRSTYYCPGCQLPKRQHAKGKPKKPGRR